MKFQAALLLAGAASAVAERVSYDGFQVFRVHAEDGEDLREKVADLNTVELTCGHADHLDVAISPDDIEAFEALGLDFEKIVDDLAVDLAEEGVVESFYGEDDSDITKRQSGLPASSWFSAYRPWAEHRTFFNQINSALPSNSRIVNVGNSYEGRQIYALKLWGTGGEGSKPVIYFHGTVHAREWISAMVVEYLTWQLATGWVNNDSLVRGFLNKYEIIIVPFVNPDGFVYTQSSDRLWRKNRQPRSGSTCVGTDENRNWNFQWSVTGGASTSPCSETYKGLAAGDTPEVRALTTFTNTFRSQGIKLFIDWHSFGQYILLPYGYNCAARAPNHAQQMAVAGTAASRIGAVSGTRWTYGPSCSTLYATTGSSPDYMSGAMNAEYSWTIELRPGPGGSSSGFVLPANQIVASGAEQWEGLKYVLSTI
jgi:carboxypeptidase A4